MSREQSRAMTVVEIPQGSTAAILDYAFVTEGVADDLSSAGGNKYFQASDVNGVAVATDHLADWSTDGTDGRVQTTMNEALVGTVRDLYCEFEVEDYNGGNLISYTFILRILKRARVA